MKLRVLLVFFVLGSAAGARADVNGCGVGNALDLRGRPNVTVMFGGPLGLTYSPACIRVVEGTAVTFSGNFATHPLLGGTVVGSVPMPDPSSPILPTNTGTSATFVLPSVGEFGYYCNAHWDDGMFGGILVEPDLIFGDGFQSVDDACPAAPGSLSGCASCVTFCENAFWPVNWGAVSAATHYVIQYTCFSTNPTYQTSNTTADLCTEIGMCNDSACANGAGPVTVKACNSTCCSAAVTFPLTETPTACGGAICC